MLQSTLPCDFALPAEWEPQSAIMLTWPHLKHRLEAVSA